MSKKENEKNRELARLYYANGDSQKLIAEKVGVTPQTVTRWVKEGNWEALKGATFVNRKKIVTDMLRELSDKVSAGNLAADEAIKIATAIEKIDKQTNVVTVIEVFSAYNNWLVSRMKIDPELTPELVKVMNKYQDIFIGEQLNGVRIEQ